MDKDNPTGESPESRNEKIRNIAIADQFMADFPACAQELLDSLRPHFQTLLRLYREGIDVSDSHEHELARRACLWAAMTFARGWSAGVTAEMEAETKGEDPEPT